MHRGAIPLGILLVAVLSAAEVPDTIYYNGHIVTMSAAQPQVQAVSIKGNRFLLTGSDTDVRKTAGPATKQIDLHGRTVLPGLEDSHTHPIVAALSERDGPIPVMNSIAEIQAYILIKPRRFPPIASSSFPRFIRRGSWIAATRRGMRSMRPRRGVSR